MVHTGKRKWLAGSVVLSLVLAAVLWSTIVAQTSHTTVRAGDYADWQMLQGWQTPYGIYDSLGRWSEADPSLRLPTSPGNGGLLTLHLLTPVPPGVAVSTTLALDSQQAQFTVVPEPRQYQFFLPPSRTQLISLTPRSDTVAAEKIGVLRVQYHHWHSPTLTAGSALLWLLGAWLIGAATARVWQRVWLLLVPLAGLSIGIGVAAMAPTLALACSSIVFGAGLALLLLSWLTQRAAHPRWWWSLAVLTIIAAFLRLYGINWDAGQVYHPDEWVFNRAAWQLKPPWNPHFFSYGSFLLYVYRFTASLLANFDQAWLEDFGRFVLIGRFYSALWSTLTVGAVAYLGWRWRDRSTGLLAALFWTFTVLAIQNAHFGTTDSFLTLLFLGITACCMRYADRPSWRRAALVGGLLGLGLATKITAAIFMIVPVLMLAALWWDSAQQLVPLKQLAGHITACLTATAAACMIFAPYYVLAWGEFSQTMVMEGSDASSGLASYTYQFIDTPPYLFQLYNLLLTCGPLLVLLALVGWGWLAVRIRRERFYVDSIIWAAPTAYFLVIGLSFTKYNRYLLIILPFLCLWAAGWLVILLDGDRWRRNISLTLGTSTALLLIIYAASFTIGVYGQPDPRLMASAWMYQHVPHQSSILTEEHEHAVLPTPLDGLGSYVYQTNKLKVYTPAYMETLDYYVDQLSNADYLIIASRSHYLPFMRNPDRFPVRACVYTQLFDGTLGFTPLREFTRAPRLGRWRLQPAAHAYLDETFEVFDHPTVLIFGKTDAERAMQLETTLRQQCGEAAPP